MEAAGTVPPSPALPPPPPPPTPSHHRRPRVREVSSRFMSPSVSSVQRRQRQQQQEGDPFCCSDENRPIENSDSPFPISTQDKVLIHNSQRKQRVSKLLKENSGGGRADQLSHPSKSYSGRIGNGFTTPSRPDTPTINVPSRFRLVHQRSSSMNASAATKLLQSSGMSLGSQPPNLNPHKVNLGSPQIEARSVSSETSSVCCNDENPSISVQDLRSSVPEGNILAPVGSGRLLSDKSSRGNEGGGSVSFKVFSSPCSRSLNFSSSNGDHLLFNSVKGSEKQVSCICKPNPNLIKSGGGICLPPVPPCAKQGTDIRKGKKGSNHQEDVHSLKLLYNRYLQWRFANVKAESSMRAQQRESEKALNSLALKISDMYDSVKRKRIELERLRRAKTLSTVVEAQIPHLEEWSALEGEYSVSLSEAIQALLNAAVQLPSKGNVKADMREVGEALNSAVKVTEAITSQMQRFMPKAEETDQSISELAKVMGGERALIEECGDLLSNAHNLQVEEFSLRSQLIQMNHNNPQKDPPND